MLGKFFFYLLFSEDWSGAVVQSVKGMRFFVDGEEVRWLARVRGEAGVCPSGATLVRPWIRERAVIVFPVWRPAYDVWGGRLVCAPEPGAPTVALVEADGELTMVITAGAAPLVLQRLGWAYLLATNVGPVAESGPLYVDGESERAGRFSGRAPPTFGGPVPARLVEHSLRRPLHVPPSEAHDADIELIVWTVDTRGAVVVSAPTVLEAGAGYGLQAGAP